MGGYFSSFWGKLFKTNQTFSILILGLANAGKTTILYQMFPHHYSGLSGRLLKPRLPSGVMSRRSRIKTSNSQRGTSVGRKGYVVRGRPTTLAPTRSSSSLTAPTSKTKSSPRPSSSRSSSTRYPLHHVEPKISAYTNPGKQARRQRCAVVVSVDPSVLAA